jgi:hypothetical protein
MQLFSWVAAQQKIRPKSDAAVIKDALVKEKEFYDRFPWAQKLKAPALLNSVSRGRQRVKEEQAWFLEGFARKDPRVLYRSGLFHTP